MVRPHPDLDYKRISVKQRGVLDKIIHSVNVFSVSQLETWYSISFVLADSMGSP